MKNKASILPFINHSKPNKIFCVGLFCLLVFAIQILAFGLLEKYSNLENNYYVIVCAILCNVTILLIVSFERWQISNSNLESNKQKLDMIRQAVELELRGKSLGGIVRDLERDNGSEFKSSDKQDSETSSEQKSAHSQIKEPDVATPETEIENIITKFKEIARIKESTTTINDGVQSNKIYAEYYSKEMLQFIIEQVKKK